MGKLKSVRILKIIAVNIAILLVLLLLLEVSLKHIAPRSKMVTGQQFIICDSDFYYIPHPVLGYFNLPGQYDCNLGEISFNLTILDDTSRYTGFNGFSPLCDSTQNLYLFGCSFTWGHGISDTQTMAYQMQSKLPCTHVKNYGIGASSTVQSYLLLKSLIKNNDKPNVVVVNYASIHDERNAFKGKWRQMWQYMLVDNKTNNAKTDYGNLSFPYAEINENDSLVFDYFPVYEILNYVKIEDKSEIIGRLSIPKLKEQIFSMDGEDIPPTEKQKLSIRVLKEIHQICVSNNIQLVVTGIHHDDDTKKVLNALDEAGILTVDISVNTYQDIYNLQPIDEHPNWLANQIYAEKALEYLKQKEIIK